MYFYINGGDIDKKEYYTFNISETDVLVNKIPLSEEEDIDYVVHLRMYYEEIVDECIEPDQYLCYDEKIKNRIINYYYKNFFLNKNGIYRSRYDMIKNSVLRCPYCGLGEIAEVDHFFPKSLYPELTSFALNMIPSCHICNNKKLITMIAIHPYYYDIENSEFNENIFVLKAEGDNGVLYFKYSINEVLVPPYLQKYIDTFNLLERYSINANYLFYNEKDMYLSLNDLNYYLSSLYENSKLLHIKAYYKFILDNIENVIDFLKQHQES